MDVSSNTSGSAVSPVHPKRRTSWGVRVAGTALLVSAAACACAASATGVVTALEYGSVPATASSTQTFAVTGTPTVSLRGSGGADVTITAGAAGEVVVAWHAVIRSVTHALAQQALGRISVSAAQVGDALHVTVRDAGFQFPPDYLLAEQVPIIGTMKALGHAAGRSCAITSPRSRSTV